MTEQNVHYLTSEQMERWRKAKIINDLTEEIELYPVAGRPVIGTLTPDEQVMYRELAYLTTHTNDNQKTLSSRVFRETAKVIDAASTPTDVQEAMKHYRVFTDDDEADAYFFEESRLKYLSSAFWFMLRSRLRSEGNNSVFSTSIGIRAGFTVVDLGKKHIG